MLVVKISTGGLGNCAEVAGAPYVYASAAFGSFVLPARCPHRGGPLHLAEIDAGGYRLVCPWHGRRTSVAKAARAGLPAVRRGREVTVVFPDEQSVEHIVNHRPMSADLSVGIGSDRVRIGASS